MIDKIKKCATSHCEYGTLRFCYVGTILVQGINDNSFTGYRDFCRHSWY